jgi:hypothetical protein
MTEAALCGGVCWIISPIYATGNPIFDDLRRLAAQIPGCEVNRSERSIHYPGGGICVVKSADDPALLRGVSLDFVVFDEAAHMARLQEVWREVIRPALADRKGKALFCSTPSGASHFFHTLFQWGQGESGWQSWQMPTSSNPFIDSAEIENARRQMSARQAAQELDALFVEDGSIFRNVRDLATAQPQDGPQAEHEYTAGIDWGRSGDYTVICIYDLTARTVAYLDRFTGLSFDVQLGRVRASLERWRPMIAIVELNSIGQPLFEQIQRWGLLATGFVGHTTTNASKAVLVDCLALALERQEITLIDDPVLIGELQAYRSETLPSGLIRYSAPDGGHDDCVMALLFAHGAGSETGPDEIRLRRVFL